METMYAVVLGLLAGALVAWLALRSTYAARLAGAETERDVLRERVGALESGAAADAHVAAELAPLRGTLEHVAAQVNTLERDRLEHFGELGSRLAEVSATTASLRLETGALAGALNASSVRGAWGEVQLRRILEHAGMLARCDFDEQVAAVTRHDARVKPDVLVRLPGGRRVVVDAKAPLTKFLAAQAPGVPPAERDALLAQHAASLRGHVRTLAAKEYWSAFDDTPELVICFVPSDAVLASALTARPELFDEALASKVVPASPATLLAMLRTIALVWQQEALTENAKEVLALGKELHARLGRLGELTVSMGKSLGKTVDTYNAFVGSLESRVLVTARRMHDLELASDPTPEPGTLERPSRRPSAPELFAALDGHDAHPELDLRTGSAAEDREERPAS